MLNGLFLHLTGNQRAESALTSALARRVAAVCFTPQ
jgi:hypothetical protein